MGALLLSTASHAQSKMGTGDPPFTEYGGDGGNLPVGCRRTSTELVALAQQLTTTQPAIQDFLRRGYTPAGGDTAFNLCDQGAAVVMLMYKRTSNIGTYGTLPVITVTTKVNPVNGEPTTNDAW